MSEQTRPRPVWAIQGLELLNERKSAAMKARAFYEQIGHMTQAAECENDAADFRRQIEAWRVRYGLEEVTE